MVGMSWMMADGADARSGQRATSLKDYVILEELFRSATGAVYKVRRKRDRRIFVLKERRVAELGRAAPPAHRRSCWKIDHPHVVTCHGHFYDGSKRASCVVLDYAAGGDLHALLKRRTLGDRAFFLPEAWIWRAFAQICGGLEHLHAAGVVHRDIKALNVLVSPTTKAVWDEPLAPPGLAPLPAEPNLKLADLGVSRQVSENTQFLRTMYGTPLYASPELCEGRPYNEKTDIWSLGVLLYELCALAPPFGGSNLLGLARNIAAGTYEPLSDHYSPLLRTVVAHMLRVDHAERPSIARLARLCRDRDTDDAAAHLDLPTPSSAAPSSTPSGAAPPAPVHVAPPVHAAPPAPAPAPPRRVEAHLRRKKLHLENLRAAASLRRGGDDVGGPPSAESAREDDQIRKVEGELRDLVAALQDAVPGRTARPPRRPRSAWGGDVASDEENRPAAEAPRRVGGPSPEALERRRRRELEEMHLGNDAANPQLEYKVQQSAKSHHRRDRL
ncbi:serine/threonine kinase [Aureococcus anophagefferens]|nr:serine/threonine kinase [Aureococcus anophagefferens]